MKIDKKKYRQLVKTYKNKLELSLDNFRWQKCYYAPDLKFIENPVIIFTENKFIEIIGKKKTYYLRIK